MDVKRKDFLAMAISM